MTEVKITNIKRVYSKPEIDAINAISGEIIKVKKDGEFVKKTAPNIGTTHSQIWIDFNDGKQVHYTADSTYTGFAVANSEPVVDGKQCFEIYDHSGTAVGYYKTKADYLKLENAIIAAGHSYVSDSFGHDGNCIIYLDASEVSGITTRN
jgi:hypothetical protein